MSVHVRERIKLKIQVVEIHERPYVYNDPHLPPLADDQAANSAFCNNNTLLRDGCEKFLRVTRCIGGMHA
jgi:hypothetical protein